MSKFSKASEISLTSALEDSICWERFFSSIGKNGGICTRLDFLSLSDDLKSLGYRAVAVIPSRGYVRVGFVTDASLGVFWQRLEILILLGLWHNWENPWCFCLTKVWSGDRVTLPRLAIAPL
jgi:hypothetical protein